MIATHPAWGPGQLYLGGPALAELAQAQAELDEHLPSGSDGRCLRCGQEIPCNTRELATNTFARYRSFATTAARAGASATDCPQVELTMPKMLIDIDPEVLAQAQGLLGTTTKKATVNVALR